MSKKLIAAIDLGASGGKTFIGEFCGGGFSFNEVYRFPNEPVEICQKDHATGREILKTYWNDLEILKNIVISLKQISARGIDTIDSLGIDSWGTDGVLFNRYGEAVDRLYNYRDHRLDEIRRDLFRLISEKELFFLTGVPSLQFNQVNQLFWYVRNRPEYMSAADFFLPVSSLFYYYLGGYRFTEYTWASTTQLLDPRKRCWNSKVFDVLGIPLSIMPDILMPGTFLGPVYDRILDETCLKSCTLSSVASHDTASAYHAAPVDDENSSLIISSGTWSLIGKLVPDPLIDDGVFEDRFTNEGGVGNIRFLRNVMGTWLVQNLKQKWEAEDGSVFSWEKLMLMAKGGEGFSAFIDPDHDSFFNPADMESAVKTFCKRTGQKVPESRGTILRVCFESLALKYKLINEKIEKASGAKNSSVCVIGGGAKNDLFNQFISDAIGLPVKAGPVEATAIGNIMVQARALGATESLEDERALIRDSFDILEFTPRQNAVWEEQFKHFRTVVDGFSK